MSAIASPLTAAQKKELVQRYNDAVAARKSATTPGDKMRTRKVCDSLALIAWRGGVKVELFEPEPKVTKRYDLTAEMLVTEITDLRAIAADDTAPARIRSTAETTCQRLIAQAERRGIEVPAQAI